MAFVNKEGMSVSYDASSLIAELKEDIEEFGEYATVWVITQEKHGVTIYKDYEFTGEGYHDFTIKDGEKVIQMEMGKLLPLYIQENSII